VKDVCECPLLLLQPERSGGNPEKRRRRDAGPPVEPLFGASPERPGAIECQGQDPVADQGVGIAGIVPQVFDPAGRRPECRFRIAGSDPDPATRVNTRARTASLARDCGSLSLCRMTVKAVSVPVPARDPLSLTAIHRSRCASSII
jgi:hypothetical protein